MPLASHYFPTWNTFAIPCSFIHAGECGLWLQFWLRHQELFKGLQTKKSDPSIRIKHLSPAVAMDRGDMEIAAPLEAAMKPSAASMEFWTQKKPEVDIADDPMPEFDVGNLEDLDTYTMSFMSQESKMEPRSSYYTFGRAGRSAPIKPVAWSYRCFIVFNIRPVKTNRLLLCSRWIYP